MHTGPPSRIQQCFHTGQFPPGTPTRMARATPARMVAGETAPAIYRIPEPTETFPTAPPSSGCAGCVRRPNTRWRRRAEAEPEPVWRTESAAPNHRRLRRPPRGTNGNASDLTSSISRDSPEAPRRYSVSTIKSLSASAIKAQVRRRLHALVRHSRLTRPIIDSTLGAYGATSSQKSGPVACQIAQAAGRPDADVLRRKSTG